MSSQNILFAVGKRPKDSICMLIQGGLDTTSSLEYAQYVAAQLGGVGAISYKKLFGEYGLRCGGKLPGTVENNQFYVKMIEAGHKHLPEAELAVPHGGRPGMYLVEGLDDKEFLIALVPDTCSQLPDPSLPKRE